MMARIHILLLTLGLAVTGAAAADSPTAAAGGAVAEESARSCAEQVALRVQSHYDSIRDLSADFEQTSRMPSLGPASASPAAKGRVIFSKPGRMRWSYEKPEPSLVVTDGKVLWTWDPGLGEAQKVNVGRGFLSGAAIQFLLGEGEVLETFEVRSESCEGARVVLELLPLDPASYERLTMEVDPKSGLVHATEVVDLFGNVTRIALADVRTDTDPPASTFTFEPPDGANVIEVPTTP
jgi:outer membrane lipoprotein carrier protein